MKSFTQYITESSEYPNADAEENEDLFKAIVEHKFAPERYGGVVVPPGGVRFLSMFPAYGKFENKYDFSRGLNKFIEDIKKDGGTIIGVHRKGDPVYDKLMKKGEFHGMTPAEAARKLKPWQKKHYK